MRATLLLAALLLLLAGCRPSPPGEPQRALEVRGALSGQSFQGREEPLAVVAPSRRALGGLLGGEVAGRLPAAEDATYLAVLWGRKPSGGYSVAVDSARLEEGRLVVRLRLRSPGPGTIVTQALTYPYAAAVIAGVEPAGREVVLTDQEGRRLHWPVRRA